MRIKIWGARGSIPAPGPETMRYGGNTSCVELTLSDGSTLILDAGTGIRNLGIALNGIREPINILLTHLHLDHVQGLMFFAPAFKRQSEITVWGPTSDDASLCERIARYISAPLAPVDVRDMPFTFRQVKELEWKIGSAIVRAGWVHHRGPTLGYRIEDGGTSLCYIPDHEPGIGTPLSDITDDWIPALNLARNATLLIHDCQYTDEEYRDHVGWGHSAVGDALEFAHRSQAERVLFFHHDPMHSDDFLDEMSGQIENRWVALGGRSNQLELATERREIVMTAPAPQAAAAS